PPSPARTGARLCRPGIPRSSATPRRRVARSARTDPPMAERGKAMSATVTAPATPSPRAVAPATSSPGLRALLLYVVGAYAWTWSYFLLKILGQRGVVGLPVPELLLDAAAGLGPLLAALAVVSFEAGGSGRRALLGQLLRWRVPRIWYAVAL